jgi:hypothetical protein
MCKQTSQQLNQIIVLDPTYQPLITIAKYLRTGQEEGMRQATDSWRIFAREKKCIDGRLLVKYQHSITTQHFMKAIEEYKTGSNLLQNYKKKSVDTEGDCDYLKPAFENYVNGHMHENSFLGNFISKDTSNLVDQYLKLKPDDFMVEYLKVLFGLTCSFTINLPSIHFFSRANILQESVACLMPSSCPVRRYFAIVISG